MVSQSEAVFSLHTNHTRTQQPHTHKLAEVSCSNGKLAFSKWKYRYYFNLLEVKGKNVHVKCSLCPGAKSLSTSVVSNSNLMKHLSTAHASTKLVAKNTVVDIVDDDSRPSVGNVSSAYKEGHGATPSKQLKLDFSAPASQKPVTQTELNGIIGRYVVENMLPLSTVDSFRALIGKIPGRAGAGPPCRKTFSKYIDAEYAKMNAELKRGF